MWLLCFPLTPFPVGATCRAVSPRRSSRRRREPLSEGGSLWPKAGLSFVLLKSFWLWLAELCLFVARDSCQTCPALACRSGGSRNSRQKKSASKWSVSSPTRHLVSGFVIPTAVLRSLSFLGVKSAPRLPPSSFSVECSKFSFSLQLLAFTSIPSYLVN